MLFIIIVVMIVMVDLGIKKFVSKKMVVGEKCPTKIKRVMWWHIKNEGVAYNHLEGRMKGIIILSGAGIFYFLYVLYQGILKKENFFATLSLSCLIGGAVGNFLERIKKGHVTDYIYIKAKGMPVFNLADVFILLGSVVFGLSSLFTKEKM